MVDEKAYHLLRVLKDVNEEEVIKKLNQIKKKNDTHISHLFLDEYFRNKDACISSDVYRYEAQCIVDIFPQYSVEYIQSMLETLGSENNRVIIILRQLLKNEPINNFTIPNRQTVLQNDCLPDYLSYKDSTEACASNSIAMSKCDNQVRNTFKEKQETFTSLKRKSNLPLPMPVAPKIKIVPFASISNTSQNNCIPETCSCVMCFNINESATSAETITNYNKRGNIPTQIEDYGFKSETKPSIDKFEPKVRPPSELFPYDYQKNSETCTNYNKNGNTSTQIEEYGFVSEIKPNIDKLEPKVKQPFAVLPFDFQENFLDKYLLSIERELDTRGQQDCQKEPLNLIPEVPIKQDLNVTITNNLPPNVEDIARNTDVTSSINGVTGFQNLQHLYPHSYLKDSFPFVDLVLGSESGASRKVTKPVLKLYKDPQGKWIRGSEKSDIAEITEIVDPKSAADPLPAYITHPKKNTYLPPQPRIAQKKIKIMETPNLGAVPKINTGPDQRAALQISSEDDEYFDSHSSEDGGDSIPDVNIQEPLYDSKLISKIMEMFPDASPGYVKELCVGRTATPADVDIVLQTMLSTPDYPKRIQREASPDPDLDLEKQVSLFKEVLPDADPNYLQYHAELYLHDKKKLAEFISSALETKNYPTRKEYLRKQQLSAQVKQYTTEFNVEKFLEIIPDPDTYFNDPKKKSSLIVNNKVEVFGLHYATSFLKNQYPMISIKTINYVMSKENDNLITTVRELDRFIASKKGLLKSRRKPISVDNTTIQNIPLLQEIAYLSHRTEIRKYLEEKAAKEKNEMELAKVSGLLRTCHCCYNEEVMPKNIVNCTNGCDFCNECVRTSAEILFGEGKLDFPCLQTCPGFFNLQTLKDVLSPKMFSKMAQKKQLEEVKSAGIEELEMCPFCDFATIPVPGDKLFRCLNPECMKESCRQCKEPSHVPLRCDEIEKDDDVKRRTYIENKMTEALIRICYKCGLKFIKADGCNKMTCSCGAMMCYVCGQPVRDYKHFNGQGGENYHLCPLYSDTNKLHKEAVIKGAEQAKVEIGVASDPKKLKIDPASDLHQHYITKKSKTEENRNMLVDGMAAARVGLDDVNQFFNILVHGNAVRRQRHRNHPHRHHRYHYADDDHHH